MQTSPDLTSYDWIVVSSSAGKDSQAMLDHVIEQADLAGAARDRIVVVHSDLGRAEWTGTGELAAEQAAHYGVRFEVVRRTQNDLLDQVAARGMWPSSKQRYCTSDHKRGPILTVLTRLAAEKHQGRPVRILQCIGLRAEESTGRAKLAAFERNERASNGRKTVDDWLPIHGWTVGQVWARIRASGVRHHYAYDLGMPRLSCCFCIFAPKAALLLAGKHNPELLQQYVDVEQRIGHTFKAGMSLASIAAELAAGAAAEAVTDWRM